MTFSRFLTAVVAGALIWVVTLVVGGYFFGNVPVIRDHMSAICFGRRGDRRRITRSRAGIPILQVAVGKEACVGMNPPPIRTDARRGSVGLGGIRACIFDAYGTLFDFASAAAGCEDVLGERSAPLTALWRDKQLQYTWLRGLQGRHADFWQVTGDALDYSMATLGISDAGLRSRLMELYLTLDPFPEFATLFRLLGNRAIAPRYCRTERRRCFPPQSSTPDSMAH